MKNTMNTMNTIETINTINNYFEEKLARENAAKKMELDEMVKTFGIDEVLNAMISHLKAKAGIKNAKVTTMQFEDAKWCIAKAKYDYRVITKNGKSVAKPIEFSDENRRILDDVAEYFKIEVSKRGDGKRNSGNITHQKFAQFIIDACGNDPQTLIDIINILRKAKWDGDYGITQFKMELVYHSIILHYERKAEVIAVITEILKDYSMTSFKVVANRDDRYRNKISIEEKMMLLLEDMVCEKIRDQRKFLGVCDRRKFRRKAA